MFDYTCPVHEWMLYRSHQLVGGTLASKHKVDMSACFSTTCLKDDRRTGKQHDRLSFFAVTASISVKRSERF
jgi:hypothetical protein